MELEDPRLDSPIHQGKLVGESSPSDSSGNNEYIPESKPEKMLGGRHDKEGTFSKVKGEEEIDFNEIDVVDERETDFEDIYLSDDEWETAMERMADVRRQKQVDEGNYAPPHATLVFNDQTKKDIGFQSQYEDSKEEIETREEINDDVPRLLRSNYRPFKVDKHTHFKKLKRNVGMTFGRHKSSKMQLPDMRSSWI